MSQPDTAALKGPASASTSSPPPRRLPRENLFVDSGPFWQGTREGKLMLQYCKDSGRFQHFPRPISLYTGTRNLEWREAGGGGTVYAVTALRTAGLGADGRLPCVLVLVELDEGVRILANMPASHPGEVVIGARVKLAWDPLEGGQYPAFALA